MKVWKTYFKNYNSITIPDPFKSLEKSDQILQEIISL